MRRALFALACLALSACGPAIQADDAAEGAPVNALAPADLSGFFDCLRERGQTVVAAHRGGPAPGYAENSIETFEHTLSQVPALLEIDIARTSDGVLVLMHDDTLDRTTTGSGAVSDTPYAQIELLRLKDETGATLEARVPRLADALRWAAGKTVLELDIKRGVAYENVVREVREANAADRVILISYSTESALRLHDLAPEMMISVSIDDADTLDELKAAGFFLPNVLAWTGTDEPDSALNVTLNGRGVEVLFGTLGGGNSWDARFERGGPQYAAFAETGIQLIATDRPFAAAADLDAHDGVEGFGVLQCAAGAP